MNLFNSASWMTYAAVRLTMRKDEIVLATGSAFIYKRNKKFYIVTNWHNLSGRRSDDLHILNKHGALPNNIIVDMPFYYHSDQQDGYGRVPVLIPLIKDEKPVYLVHQQKWPRVDVAVIPLDLNNDYTSEVYLSDGTTRRFPHTLAGTQADGSIVALPYFERDPEADLTSGTAMEIRHTVGDDIFLLGYPADIFDKLINPIWKRASIASSFEEGWNGQDMFLIDCASRRGMSGCIAVYYSKDGVVPVRPGSGLKVGKPVRILLGVYAGRFGDSEFEAQVGRVWKMDVVDQIIDHNSVDLLSEYIECAVSEIESVIIDEWPGDEAAAADFRLEKPRLDYFTHHVMEALEGRASFHYVRSKIIERASIIEDEQSDRR